MGFEQFMKKNQVIDEEIVEYAATETLKDENGKPLRWKFRKVPSKLYFHNVSMKSSDVDEAKRLICMSCVYPNLRDKELQDSYGVKTPEDLLIEMIPDLAEMTKLGRFVADLNSIDMDQEIKEAKN